MTLAARARSVAAIALLEATLPLNLALVGAAMARRGRRQPRPELGPDARRTVLISGGKMTKALVLARLFHAAGHRVVLVETERYRWTAHRFSNAVDAFHVVPDASSDDFAEAVLRIVKDEEVDVWVPVSSPASSLPEAQAAERLAGHCEVVHLDTAHLALVDDKHAFAEMAEAVGLPMPATHRITDPRQVLDFDFAAAPGPWVLKSIPYDPVRRLDLTPLPRPTPSETEAFVRDLPISPEQPWILQELLSGTEWCTHGTARDGRLQVWACCRSSAWQLTYEQVDHPAVREWVERFVGAYGLTGQVSFDFMEGQDGVVRAIECNPRTHSAITLLAGRPEVAAAYLDDGADPVAPPVGGRPTYWLHHELWQALRHPSTAPARLRTVLRGTDAVLDGHDPLPFLALHHVHLPSLLLRNLRAGRSWLKIDVNIGKLVEAAGD
ncbi:hypothetical protein ABFT23_18155 [Nocardioides sp. C4-1]|uniref:hypothetical protein n=1 Tax=Nocardioides sp. C4-1 TaxID=3151851 RepID=UPI0032634169